MLRETAYAKINLALHVRRRRPDGYHELDTIFAFAEDGDLLEAESADHLSLMIDGPFAAGLEIDDNLVMNAARALGAGRGATIRLTKNLPVASGIGGGSADAAAALRVLARLWGMADSRHLMAIAKTLGSDVPACLGSETSCGGGRGDELSHLEGPTLAATPVLLVNPFETLATSAVFAGWDGLDRGALGDRASWRNDLTDAAIAHVPEIQAILDALAKQQGAQVIRMSGSGATCFALFASLAERDRAAAAMSSNWWTLSSVLR